MKAEDMVSDIRDTKTPIVPREAVIATTELLCQHKCHLQMLIDDGISTRAIYRKNKVFGEFCKELQEWIFATEENPKLHEF